MKEKHSLQGDAEAAEADSALPFEQASAAEYDHRDSIGGILSEVDVYAKASAALVEEVSDWLSTKYLTINVVCFSSKTSKKRKNYKRFS